MLQGDWIVRLGLILKVETRVIYDTVFIVSVIHLIRGKTLTLFLPSHEVRLRHLDQIRRGSSLQTTELFIGNICHCTPRPFITDGDGLEKVIQVRDEGVEE